MEENFNMNVNVQPIYADEANVNANIKFNFEKINENEEKIRKIGRIDIMFFDQLTKTVVSRIVLDPFTAKVLGNMLIQNANKTIGELDSPNVPEEVKKQMELRKIAMEEQKKPSNPNTNFNTYIG